MVYVKRDSSGAIVALSQQPQADCVEPLAADNEELQVFVQSLGGDQSRLEASDQDFVRVLEDVVELMVAKGLILFTELPMSAQQKIMQRQRLRSELGVSLDLIGDD